MIISQICAKSFSAIHKTGHNDDFIGVSFQRHDYLLSIYPVALEECVSVCACKISSGLFGNIFI